MRKPGRDHGERAQSTGSSTVFNRLNCSDKETYPRHQQGMPGELWSWEKQGLVRAGDTQASCLQTNATFEKTRVFEGNYTFQ